MSPVSPARRAAFSILRAVESGKGHSDNLLRGPAVAALSEADRKLATALVLGSLRWQIELDGQIRPLLKHPNAKIDGDVLIAMRLGAFQLLQMDRIPARAAIDESVELAKQAGHRFASGMVNAVLRKLAQSGKPTNYAAEENGQGHPAWMVDRWRGFYGEEAVCGICAHGQRQPVLSIRISGPEVEAELASESVSLAPGEFLGSARHVIAGDVSQTRAFQNNRVRIQDEGSQLIAELLPRGDAILDCCAAPGGKTLILAERNPAAHIIACESSPERLVQLQWRVAGLGERVECRPADATMLNEKAAFDLALADVPCSGTGTLGRNPEIRHRLRPEDLQRHSERQLAILRSSLQAVRGGGHVLYSTCSMEPEENENVVAAVLHGSQDTRLVPLGARIEELAGEGILLQSGLTKLRASLTSEGFLHLLPGGSGNDGFFAALLERKRLAPEITSL